MSKSKISQNFLLKSTNMRTSGLLFLTIVPPSQGFKTCFVAMYFFPHLHTFVNYKFFFSLELFCPWKFFIDVTYKKNFVPKRKPRKNIKFSALSMVSKLATVTCSVTCWKNSYMLDPTVQWRWYLYSMIYSFPW